jgi:hypothetical protein
MFTARMCRYGAHQIGGEEAPGREAGEGDAFAAEGIEAILQNRTEKRQIGSRAGNSFSTATFAAPDVRRSLIDLWSDATALQPAALQVLLPRTHAPVLLALICASEDGGAAEHHVTAVKSSNCASAMGRKQE